MFSSEQEHVQEYPSFIKMPCAVHKVSWPFFFTIKFTKGFALKSYIKKKLYKGAMYQQKKIEIKNKNNTLLSCTMCAKFLSTKDHESI